MKVSTAMRLLPVIALLALLRPGDAAAYGVAGGARLERVDALIAWDRGRQVVVVSPVVSGTGSFLLPLPAGAEPAAAPPADALLHSTESVADDRDDARAKAPAAPDASGRRVAPPPEVRLPGIAEVTLEALTAFEEEESLRVWLGPQAKSLSDRGPAVYFDARWSVAAAPLPDGTGSRRLAPVAYLFDAPRPTLPIRLASGGGVHTLALTVLTRGGVTDLGGMDAALGLRRATDARLAPEGAAAWADSVLGGDGPAWTTESLAAPSIGGGRFDPTLLEVDLSLSPPAGRAPEATRPRRDAPAPKPTSRGCGGCASSSPLGGVLGLLLALGVAFRRV